MQITEARTAAAPKLLPLFTKTLLAVEVGSASQLPVELLKVSTWPVVGVAPSEFDRCLRAPDARSQDEARLPRR